MMNTAPAPHPLPPPPMSPGAYVKKRRIAADCTVDQVALFLCSVAGKAAPASPSLPTSLAASREAAAGVRNELLMLEADAPGDFSALLSRLPTAFRFDPETYRTLVLAAADPQAPIPIVEICRSCACTWLDACAEPDGASCAWTVVPPGEAPLCTRCQRQGPANEA